ncbi:MAG: SDR family oxidoreductase, partial [Flavobacteriaceae bacterium]
MFSGKRLGLMGFAIFLLVNTSALFAQAFMESFVEEGNEAYNQGDYKKAIALYEQTLSMGQHSAALYFNLGNAYYKLNEVAESVYYFEKAQQLNPKDENILVNSAFAKNMTIDSIEELPQSQIEQFKNQLYGLFSLDTWS